MPERLFTIYQVADLLGATPGAVMEWIRRGWMPIQQLGDGATRVSERGLVRFLRQQGIDIEKMLAKVTEREKAATGATRDSWTVPTRPDEPRPPRWRDLDAKPAATIQDSIPAAPPDSVPPAPQQSVSAPPYWPNRPVFAPPAGLDGLPARPADGGATGGNGGGDGSGRGNGGGNGGSGISASLHVTSEAQPKQPGVSDATPDGLAQAQPMQGAYAPAGLPAAAAAPARAVDADPADAGADDSLDDSPAVDLHAQPLPEPTSTPTGLVAQVADAILADAARRGASAVHLQREAGRLGLRLRIEGNLHDKPQFDARLPAEARATLLEHFIAKAGQTDQPAGTGSFEAELGQGPVTVQVAWAQAGQARRLVLRIPEHAMTLEQLGATDPQRALLAALVGGPGLILVTGLWPNQRRSTIEAILSNASLQPDSVLAVADQTWRLRGAACLTPSAGADKASLLAAAGADKASLLAAAGGLDADLIVVDELADPAALAAAMELSRRMAVLAGVHAADGPSAAALLAQMGSAGWSAAGTVSAIVEQASLRQTCPDCRDGQRSGCGRCGGSGYAGTSRLMNVMEGPALRAMLARTSVPALEAPMSYAPQIQTTLGQLARGLVQSGLTSEAQLARAGLK